MNQLFQGLLALGIAMLLLVGMFALYENVSTSAHAQNMQQTVTTVFADMQNAFALSPSGVSSVTGATVSAMGAFPQSWVYSGGKFVANGGETFQVAAGAAGTNEYTLTGSNLDGKECQTLGETYNGNTVSLTAAGKTFTDTNGVWGPSTPNGAACLPANNTVSWIQKVG